MSAQDTIWTAHDEAHALYIFDRMRLRMGVKEMQSLAQLKRGGCRRSAWNVWPPIRDQKIHAHQIDQIKTASVLESIAVDGGTRVRAELSV